MGKKLVAGTIATIAATGLILAEKGNKAKPPKEKPLAVKKVDMDTINSILETVINRRDTLRGMMDGKPAKREEIKKAYEELNYLIKAADKLKNPKYMPSFDESPYAYLSYIRAYNEFAEREFSRRLRPLTLQDIPKIWSFLEKEAYIIGYVEKGDMLNIKSFDKLKAKKGGLVEKEWIRVKGLVSSLLILAQFRLLQFDNVHMWARKMAFNKITSALEDATAESLESEMKDPKKWDKFYKLTRGFLLSCGLDIKRMENGEFEVSIIDKKGFYSTYLKFKTIVKNNWPKLK